VNLEEEANVARTENLDLYAELSKRQILASDLISTQQTSYDELQRAEIEHEVMLTAADMYEKHIAIANELLEKVERYYNKS
jgi:hypothetical protein